MKITTWNVNSVQMRLPRILEFLAAENPDFLSLQEIKTVEEKFPLQVFTDLGYHCTVFGQKAYNGVALLSKERPSEIRRLTLLSERQDARCLHTQFENLGIYTVYIPNGQAVTHPNYQYKLSWYEKLRMELQTREGKPTVVLGDFNVAPENRDVHRPDWWEGRLLCSQPERQALKAIFDLGFIDLFRLKNQEGGTYSWWDYRNLSFVKNDGLRIDLILGNSAIAKKTEQVLHHRDFRKGTKPSDHVPVTLVLNP